MADEAPQSVVLHHISRGLPGFTVKTRSGCHYTFDANGEIEVPGHLAEFHVRELTHISRGHRIGLHPDHQAKVDRAQARAGKAEEKEAAVVAESPTPEKKS